MFNADNFSERLWFLIAAANGNELELRRLLSTKPKSVIVAFDREFRRASDNLRDIEVPDLSEDELKDLYSQVVSKGKEYYDYIIQHPEWILRDTKPEDPCYFGVAGSVLLERFGE